MPSWTSHGVLILLTGSALLFDPGSFDPGSPKRPLLALGLGLLTLVTARSHRWARPGEDRSLAPLDVWGLGWILVLVGTSLLAPVVSHRSAALIDLMRVVAAYRLGRSCRLEPAALAGHLALGSVVLVVSGVGMWAGGLWTKPVPSGHTGLAAFELVSGLTNPDYLAAWLLLGLPVVAPRVPGPVTAFMAAGLLATYSRAGWLALGLAAALGHRRWIRSPARRIVAGALVLGLVPLGFLALGGPGLDKLGSTATLGKRLHIYAAAARAFLEAPGSGHGMGAFPVVHARYRTPGDERAVPLITDFAHGLPLQVAAEAGLPGLVGGILVLLVACRQGRESSMTPLGADLAVGLGAFAIHNLLSVSAFIPATSALAAFLLGRYALETSTGPGGLQDGAGSRAGPVRRTSRRRGETPVRPSISPIAVVLGGGLVAAGWRELGHHRGLAAAGRAAGHPDRLAAASVRCGPRPDLRYRLAGTLTRTGRPAAALAQYLLLESTDPAFSRLDFNRGRLMLDLGRPAPARGPLERQLRREPRSVPVLYALAEQAWLEGRIADSRTHLKACRAAGPPPALRDHLAKLEEMAARVAGVSSSH